jgi:hypothetical protein
MKKGPQAGTVPVTVPPAASRSKSSRQLLRKGTWSKTLDGGRRLFWPHRKIPTFDPKLAAGTETGVVRTQEKHAVSYFLRAAEAPQQVKVRGDSFGPRLVTG